MLPSRQRNVSARHLLRLGSGEADLQESLAHGGALGSGRGEGEAFSKQGRVQWSLARRLQLLGLVRRLGSSLSVFTDIDGSCENASYFQLEHIQSRIEKFRIDIRTAAKSSLSIPAIFPFAGYFSDVQEQLFNGTQQCELICSIVCELNFSF
jgi:hypothetical protein